MNETVHVAITRQVKPGYEDRFEDAIRRFFVETLEDSGSLGAQLIHPLPKTSSRTYGILRSFASEQDRDRFYRSDRFRDWEQAVQPFVENTYERRNLHGLEAFFSNPGLMRHPPRWKMALVTWAGVWPSVFAVSSLAAPRLSGWPSWLATGAVTLIVVLVLTWGVMPLLTRLVRPWLTMPTEKQSITKR